MNRITFVQLFGIAAWIILFALGNVSFAMAKNKENKQFLSLQSAVEMALESNPNIDRLESLFNASLQIPDQVGAMPEPRLMLNTANLPIDSFALNRTPMTQLQIGLTQTIPYPGKLDLKKQVADQEAQAHKQSIYLTVKKIKQQVKHLWWQLKF